MFLSKKIQKITVVFLKSKKRISLLIWIGKNKRQVMWIQKMIHVFKIGRTD